MKTLGLDLDNTFCDFTQGFRNHVATASMLTEDEAMLHLPEPTVYDFADWDWHQTAYKGLSEAFAAAEGVPGFYSGLRALEGAADAVGELRADGYDVIIVTSREQRWLEETVEAARNWGLHYDGIVFAPVKYPLSTSVDIFIDDSPSHLADFWREGIDAIAFTTGYNIDSPALARVDCWSQVGDAVRKM